MKAKYKKLWVKRLLSGRYKQTTSVLVGSGGNSFCCLGVLRTCLPLDHKLRHESKEGRGEELTGKQLKEFGLTLRQHEALTHLNDEEGYTFKQIARFLTTTHSAPMRNGGKNRTFSQLGK
jgi:hypothetical protein